MIFISALSLGLLGSLHCLGMCGPIALAIPLKNSSWTNRIISSLLYNLSRAFCYACMGFLFGLLGKGFQLSGIQKYVSIIMGILMIASVLLPSLFKASGIGKSISNKYISLVKKFLGKQFGKKTYQSYLYIGFLNGLLPCGLVYFALASAVNTSSPNSGALFMFIFGLGTIPMLFALSIMGNVIGMELRKRINKIIPAAIILVGIIFILRGLTLGIPYLSPSESKLDILNKTDKIENACCGKTD